MKSRFFEIILLLGLQLALLAVNLVRYWRPTVAGMATEIIAMKKEVRKWLEI